MEIKKTNSVTVTVEGDELTALVSAVKKLGDQRVGFAKVQLEPDEQKAFDEFQKGLQS